MGTSFQRWVSQFDLGPVYMEKPCPGLNSHSPSTRAIVSSYLGRATEYPFYKRNKRMALLVGDPDNLFI